jgi:hypothetical protein
MPRYLVEHSVSGAGELTTVELQDITQQSQRVQKELRYRIQWLQSTITEDRMICLYIAENEAIVKEYARRSGLPIERICRISAVICPASDILN